MYETREEFVNTVRQQYGQQYRNFTDDEVYTDYTSRYPEYKSRIKSEQVTEPEMVNLYEDDTTEEELTKKHSLLV